MQDGATTTGEAGPGATEGERPQAAGSDLRGPAAVVAAGVLVFAVTRLCFPIHGLGNADIAGIFYEADLLLAGGVPYVDSIDMKPPGTFFLVAGIFAGVARELWAVQLVYALWCLLGAPAVWVAARALYGSAMTAALAVLLYLVSIGTFDFNYSAWMTPMYAWAFACLIAGVRGGRPGWHLAAGTCATLALALKGQAVVLAPVFALVWLWGRRRGEPGARWWAWPLWLVGAGLGALPFVLWYASRGAVGPLLAGLVPVAEAQAYAATVQPEGWWVFKAWRIPFQHARVFPLQSLLVAAVLVGLWRGRREAVPEDRSKLAPVAPQLSFWLLSVVGCGIGGLRFYIHYLPQYLPALALLAVHPDGLAWWRSRRIGGRALAGLCALLMAVQLVRIPLGVANVDYRGSKNATKAGEYIRRRTSPDDRILVWGWAAWSSYFYAQRRSPSAIFKVLGQVTEYNQNGMFTRSKSANFKPGPYADRLLADFKRSPPAYIVKTRLFFPGVKQDPLKQFTELDEIFRRDYVVDRKFGRLVVYEHRARRKGKERRQDRRR